MSTCTKADIEEKILSAWGESELTDQTDGLVKAIADTICNHIEELEKKVDSAQVVVASGSSAGTYPVQYTYTY